MFHLKNTKVDYRLTSANSSSFSSSCDWSWERSRIKADARSSASLRARAVSSRAACVSARSPSAACLALTAVARAHSVSSSFHNKQHLISLLGEYNFISRLNELRARDRKTCSSVKLPTLKVWPIDKELYKWVYKRIQIRSINKRRQIYSVNHWEKVRTWQR